MVTLVTSPNGFWPDMATNHDPNSLPMPEAAGDHSADFGLPGSPEWWLRRLVNMLLVRQPQLDMREAYVDGNHPLPTGDRRWIQAVRTLQKKARTNYCGLVTGAKVERMRVRGFRFGPVGTADDDAKMFWAANDMDLQAAITHQRAAKYGMSYMLVSPPDPNRAGMPVITAEDPRQCIVYRDPVRPTRAIAGLRLWADDITGHVLAVLYLPDMIYGFVGPAVQDIQGLTIEGLRYRLLGLAGGPAGFTRTDEMANELGEVPLVEYVWRPESGIIPEGEAGEDVRDIQDRINHTILDRMVITRAQAYKQRYATGIKVPKAEKGQRKPPFDPGADVLWVSNSPDAKFGEFSSADITQILAAVRDDVVDIAAITKTPPHYLMGRMANISGDTLTQAESGFVSGIRQRQASMGWSHETVIKLCFKYLNDPKAEEVEAATLWEDPEMHTTAELADAALKWSQAGIPLELIMDRLNFQPDEIAFAIKERDRREQQQMQQQKDMAEHAASLQPNNPGSGSSGANATQEGQ